LEVDVQQDNFKILQLLHQVLIYFLVKKWIPPSRSKTAEFGKKTEGILGVNTCFQQKFATGSYGVGIGRAWCLDSNRPIFGLEKF
jgi:hypothetical protein